MSYTFATNRAGSQRMAQIAAFFDPLSAAFIKQHAPSDARVVADLGCGPGCTTRMLANVTGAAEIYGFDASPDAIAAAQAAHPQFKFIRHDVLQTPWPVRPGLAYGRFLLSHLPQPNDCIAMWLTQLAPGGMLLLDELHQIEPGCRTLSEYLDVTYRLVASQGATMDVGQFIEPPDGCRVIADTIARITVPNDMAATWFAHNVREVWPTNEWVRAHVEESERRRLLDELNEMDDAGHCVWHMRRLALAGAPT